MCFLGVGKGTFAKLISKLGINKKAILHISLGDILRKFDICDTKAGLNSVEYSTIRYCLSSGKLISDDLANSIVSYELNSNVQKYTNNEISFILDGLGFYSGVHICFS